MARIKNGILSGALSDLVIRKRGKEQFVYSRPEEVNNPRTKRQQAQRCKFLNIINCYRQFAEKGMLKNAFEDKKDAQTDYSRFQGLNLKQRAVYLTKEEGQRLWAIVAPYVVSQGSLISIGEYIADGVLHTDLSLGDLEITPDTTVGDLYRALKANNDEWQRGDELWWVACHQQRSEYEDDNRPWTDCNVHRVQLFNYSKKLSEAWGARISKDSGGCLCHEVGTGGYTFIHRREGEKKVSVSSQQLLVCNPLFDEYNSEAQMEKAVKSFG